MCRRSSGLTPDAAAEPLEIAGVRRLCGRGLFLRRSILRDPEIFLGFTREIAALPRDISWVGIVFYRGLFSCVFILQNPGIFLGSIPEITSLPQEILWVKVVLFLDSDRLHVVQVDPGYCDDTPGVCLGSGEGFVLVSVQFARPRGFPGGLSLVILHYPGDLLGSGCYLLWVVASCA